MQRILLNVQAFEKEFARKQMDCYQDDKKKELATKRKELSKLKQRTNEIDNLIQRLYEDNVSGKISDERYATLSLSYEEEQKQIKAEIPELESYLSSETDKSESLQKFINKVKQITELKELTPELIHEFIDKIVVYASRYLDSKRVQIIDIYYNGVGILRELTPEEMENAFQQHLSKRKQKRHSKRYTVQNLILILNYKSHHLGHTFLTKGAPKAGAFYHQSSFSSLTLSIISCGIASPCFTTSMQSIERINAIGQ